MSENSYKDFIINNHDELKYISERTYDDSYSIYFGKDMSSPIKDVCFARLYRQLESKKNSIYYLLKLPFLKTDKIGNMTANWIDYFSVLRNMANIINGVYDMHILRSGFKNIKIITFENKIELEYKIDYSLFLILFCILRGMDSEYFNSWKNNKTICEYKPAKTLFEYIYNYGIVTHGSSGHDINDDLAISFSNNNPLKKVIVKNFINILKETMFTDKYLKDERYAKYFDNYYKNSHYYATYTMQTDCFNAIAETTRKIIMEDRK